jgi:hypothetical protein
MRLFVNEVLDYLLQHDGYGRSYLVDFEVYQERDKQNHAWGMRTWQSKMSDGANIYWITLYISNADLLIGFVNKDVGGNDIWRSIVTTRSGTVGGNQIRQHIINIATSMFNESTMVLRMYNDSYSDASRRAFLTNILRILG